MVAGGGHYYGGIGTLAALTRAELVQSIREYAQTTERPTAEGWKAWSKRGLIGIYQNFSGWRDALDAALAGVTPDYEAAPVPSTARPIDQLLQDRIEEFERYKAHYEATNLLPVRVNIDGPVGIAHFGDPHIDDPGTDIAAIKDAVETVRTTAGMFACNVGDTTNNWTGRLAKLYAEQSTTSEEAWVLAEWLFSACPWLYVIGGNHDLWSGSGDPLKWIAKQARVPYGPSQVRLNLCFPNKREVRVNLRHDHPGHSQWNAAHGPAKAAQLGWTDHILTCGHTHQSGYNVVRDEMTGTLSHCLRVCSFKRYDRYARERGFNLRSIEPVVVTVIDPDAQSEAELVTVFLSLHSAARYLTLLRRERGKAA